MKKKNSSPLFLRMNEVCYYLDLPEAAVCRLIKEKEFPVVYAHGSVYIPKASFFAWLEYSCGGAA